MTEQKPKISIVIPSYQHGRDLPRCLDSIFAQTFRDFEVIVVNDGSTDDTEKRLVPYHDRIIYVRQENKGGNAARNHGASLAKGDLLFFADADLVMREDCLEVLLSALEANPEAAYAYPAYSLGIKRFFARPFSAEALYKRNFIHTSALIRREKFPGFDESIRKLQDWDLWLTMLKRGDRGVMVSERLFKCVPHEGGISTWAPEILYDTGLQKLGLRSRAVEKYREAEKIIRTKHRLPAFDELPDPALLPHRVFRLALLLFLLVELVSFVGFRIPSIGIAAFVVAATLMAFVSYLRPDVALLVVIAELVAGSQGGYLFSLPLGDSALSIRIAFFLAFAAAWLARTSLAVLRRDWLSADLTWWKKIRASGFFWPYVSLVTVIALAFANGLRLGNGFPAAFFDANGFAYFALLPAVVGAWRAETWDRLKAVISAGLLVAVAKALMILYVFSHRFLDVAPNIYKWVRDTRVGEITLMQADFYRIFFQSQVFTVAAAFMTTFILLYARRWHWRTQAAGVFLLSAIAMILSLSRSFWFGTLAAVLVMLVMLVVVRAKAVVWRRLFFPIAALGVFAILIIAGTYAFPWPKTYGHGGFAMVLSDRLSQTDDAAVMSRWELLPKLNAAFAEHPLIGSGFGKAVTYESKDPRVIAMTGGRYTTTAFEWGYHDLAIKLGLMGTAVYGWFLWVLMWPMVQKVWRRRAHLRAPEPGLAPEQSDTILAAGLLLSFVALLLIHVFSPYLNHPLGIGLLMIGVAVVIGWKKESKST